MYTILLYYCTVPQTNFDRSWTNCHATSLLKRGAIMSNNELSLNLYNLMWVIQYLLETDVDLDKRYVIRLCLNCEGFLSV